MAKKAAKKAAAAAAAAAPAVQNIVIDGQTIPLVKNATDFIVQTPELPIPEGLDLVGLPLSGPALNDRLNANLEKKLTSGLTLFRATPATRDAEMDKARLTNVAHHVYTRPDTGEEIRINDRLYLKLKQEDPQTLETLIDTYKLKYLKAIGGEHLLQITEATESNTIKLSSKLLALPEVDSAYPEILHALQRQDWQTDVQSAALFKQQWYLEDGQIQHPDLRQGADINIQGAWAHTTGSPEIVVAVIDDGFDLGHSAFTGTPIHPEQRHFWLDQFFRDASAGPTDYHGTPVAGIIFGSPTGGGIHGIAPGCTFLPIRIEFGPQAPSDILAVFEHASTYADVVNCSFGFSPSSMRLISAGVAAEISRMGRTGGRRGRGLVFVFSAANDDSPTRLDAAGNLNGITYFNYATRTLQTLPAGIRIHGGYPTVPDVITVAAMSSLRRKSGYSNWGPDVTVCAPSDNWHGNTYAAPSALRTKFVANYRGLGQVTATNRPGHGEAFAALPDAATTPLPENHYTKGFGGTSGAAPVVTGIAALILSANPNLTAAEVRQILIQTASKEVDQTLDLASDPNHQGLAGAFNTSGHSLFFGAGRADATAAVLEALKRAGAAVHQPPNPALLARLGALEQAVAALQPAARARGIALLQNEAKLAGPQGPAQEPYAVSGLGDRNYSGLRARHRGVKNGHAALKRGHTYNRTSGFLWWEFRFNSDAQGGQGFDAIILSELPNYANWLAQNYFNDVAHSIDQYTLSDVIGYGDLCEKIHAAIHSTHKLP